MSKKKGYILGFLVLCICVTGIVFFRWHVSRQEGALGDKIIYFGKEPTTTENSTYVESYGEQSEKQGERDDQEKGLSGLESEETARPTQTPPVQTATPEPSYPSITSNEKVHTYDTGTVVVGDTGYELYNYVSSAADRYAKTINKLTRTLDSGVAVYDMIAPTSIGITYPDNKKKSLNSSSQDTALKNIEKKLSGREDFVPLYDVFMQHRREYLFFRTDHHWTQLGAYYAYRAFCQEKGMTPNALSSYRKKTFSGFLGTFYRDSKQNKKLKEDTLEVFYPISKNVSMEYTNTEGKKGTAPLIADGKNYGGSMKYLVYIAGDNPYTVVKNQDKHDGTSCILVKESYGNAFVPYLVDHYETIYVIDYRYWEGNLASFVKKKRAKEVIVLNNISMTRNSYLIGKLAQIISR